MTTTHIPTDIATIIIQFLTNDLQALLSLELVCKAFVKRETVLFQTNEHYRLIFYDLYFQHNVNLLSKLDSTLVTSHVKVWDNLPTGLKQKIDSVARKNEATLTDQFHRLTGFYLLDQNAIDWRRSCLDYLNKVVHGQSEDLIAAIRKHERTVQQLKCLFDSYSEEKKQLNTLNFQLCSPNTTKDLLVKRFLALFGATSTTHIIINDTVYKCCFQSVANTPPDAVILILDVASDQTSSMHVSADLRKILGAQKGDDKQVYDMLNNVTQSASTKLLHLAPTDYAERLREFKMEATHEKNDYMLQKIETFNDLAKITLNLDVPAVILAVNENEFPWMRRRSPEQVTNLLTHLKTQFDQAIRYEPVSLESHLQLVPLLQDIIRKYCSVCQKRQQTRMELCQLFFPKSESSCHVM